MKVWKTIREQRSDLTDYVIHFTKTRSHFDANLGLPGGFRQASDVFHDILRHGFIKPHFGRIRGKRTKNVHITVRGPHPAVCLTEQPLSAVLVTRRCDPSRYSGFGIAYHKYALSAAGGNPVLYGKKRLMGRRTRNGEPGYEEDKEVYTGGLPKELQYLCVNYEPALPNADECIDFTWEREWRVKCAEPGLPVFLEEYNCGYSEERPAGALIVETDDDVDKAKTLLQDIARKGATWAEKLTCIISLQTAERMLGQGDERYFRIESWPK